MRTKIKKLKQQGLYRTVIRFTWRRFLLRCGLVQKRINNKWLIDQKYLPLNEDHFPLYRTIHEDYYERLGGFPNLKQPETYNDKIQWLKLFDQISLKVQCADKLGLREFVKERLAGDSHLPKLYFSGSELTQSNIEALPQSFVLKTNHDSGSVFLIRDKSMVNWSEIIRKFDSSLKRTYGENYGEWMYKHIKPKIFAEEFLGTTKYNTPPADFKFHCSNGNVKFLQYIWDRGRNTKEVITDRSGSVLKGVHLDNNFTLGKCFNIPPEFPSLIELSERLSKGFKYVRVDLYLISHKIYVGELTFLPFRGCYSGNGQKQLGKLISFDMHATPLYSPGIN